jgi:hypothetical protein
MRSIFMANLIGYGSDLGTGQGIRLCEIEPDKAFEESGVRADELAARWAPRTQSPIIATDA